MMVTAERAEWGVADVWKHATDYHRKEVIGSALALMCRPSGKDVPILEQILTEEDIGTAREAAILLVRALGLAALPKIKQAEDRRQTTPSVKKRRTLGMKASSLYECYELLQAICDLDHEEAERFLLDEAAIERIEESDSLRWPPFLALAPRIGRPQTLRRLLERIQSTLMFPSDIECSVSALGSLHGDGLQNVREALDALEKWPEKERARQLVRQEYGSGHPAHRLLAACLGDGNQKAFVIENVREAKRQGWYADAIQQMSRAVDRKTQEMGKDDERLKRVLTEATGPDTFHELFDREFAPETALSEARRRRNELVLAARAARVLDIGEISVQLRTLTEHVTAKTSALYLEAFAASAALSKLVELDWVLRGLRDISAPPPHMYGFGERVVDYYTANVEPDQLAGKLRRLHKEFLNSLAEEDDRPTKRTYLVHFIEKVVRGAPQNEEVKAVARHSWVNHERFRKANDKHMEDGFLFLLRTIQYAAGRRFLDVTTGSLDKK